MTSSFIKFLARLKWKTTANSTLASVFFEEKKPNAKLQTVVLHYNKPLTNDKIL
jgi:hypothetical protein